MAGVLIVKDLGKDVPYSEAMALQDEVYEKRKSGETGDTLFLLEHRPVYTLGRSADPAHILWQKDALEKAGIDVVQTNRGGDVTYHGPGQLVGYPVVNLKELGIGVVDYVNAIEEAILRSLRIMGIDNAGRDDRNRGVWVGDCKICAVGIRVSHQITRHGFALNLNTKLTDFKGIVPCGLFNAGVTSLAMLTGKVADMDEARRIVAESFRDVLGYSALSN